MIDVALQDTEIAKTLKAHSGFLGEIEIDRTRHYFGATPSRVIFSRGGESEDFMLATAATAEEAMKALWAKLTMDNRFLTVDATGNNDDSRWTGVQWRNRPVLSGADDYYEDNYAWNGIRFVPIKSAGFYGSVEETVAFANTLKFLANPLKNYNPDALIGGANGCRAESPAAQEKYQHIPDGVNITPVGFYFP